MPVKAGGSISLITWILIGGVLEAFMLFLVLPVFTQHFPDLYQINHFPDGYDQLASNPLAGNGYRFFPYTSETLLRTPGYPLLLTLIFYPSPNSLLAVKVVNLTLGLFTAWIVAILTWRFTAHNAVVILASLLFLFHPATIFAQSRGGVEEPRIRRGAVKETGEENFVSIPPRPPAGSHRDPNSFLLCLLTQSQH